MNREQIMEAIRQLAHSQGSYGRFYRYLCEMREEDPDRFDEVMTMLEDENFKDAVDLIMYLES